MSKTSLEARERQIDTTIWAKEMLAQQYGRVFEDGWDALNAATNRLAVAAAFPVQRVDLGQWNHSQSLPHGVEVRASTGAGPSLSGADWTRYVTQWHDAGWRLQQCEFRHNQFTPAAEGNPAQSRFYFAAHLTNALQLERAILDGDLVVDWSESAVRTGQPPMVRRIDASGLTVKTRAGPPPFQQILSESMPSAEGVTWIDPLLVYDLDGDGFPEIILLAKNRVYRRQTDGSYRSEVLCSHFKEIIFSGLLADLDSDGFVDLLCAIPQGLVLYRGSERGTFDQPGVMVWASALPLVNPMALTCGDIDRDGDLDLFLGQYRVPTLGQVLAPNYYDANDGHPAHLLLNDGHGRFADATTAAGLDAKRRRRVFSASFVDLNRDGALDLFVSSDFAGADVYRNDGAGHFVDATHDWLPESHGFGMGQTVADFNQDGRLDLLDLGMTSPTVDRLEHLHLERPLAGSDPAIRRHMAFGNRLFLSRTDGGFAQTPMGETVARSGWSWGCAAADFDNDSFPDIYITNGHDSRQTVREYEPEFWLHDIFIERSVDDVSATTYFMGKFGRTRGAGWSYGGWDKNRLYWNQTGASFAEVGHLFGVAAEDDSRCAVAADLDADGRPDLIFTTVQQSPELKHGLRIYRNALTDTGRWIGFRFRNAPGRPVIGTTVRVRWTGHETVRAIVTGDSLHSVPSTPHFGLGSAQAVEAAEIRWPDGEITTIHHPAIDQYHSVSQPH